MTEKKPIVLGIRFGDNDFYYTFMALLDNMKISDAKIFRTSKQGTLNIINSSLYCMYLLYQNKGEYFYPTTKDYLKITDEDLLFGEEEVDKYLKNNPWDNGETFILDTRRKENPIFCI